MPIKSEIRQACTGDGGTRQVSNFVKVAFGWVVPLMIALMSFVVAMLIMRGEIQVDDSTPDWSAIVSLVSGFTLAALIRYATDTYILAHTTEAQFRSQHYLAVKMEVWKRWTDLYDSVTLFWAVSKYAYAKWAGSTSRDATEQKQPPKTLSDLLNQVKLPPDEWAENGLVIVPGAEDADGSTTVIAFDESRLITPALKWMWSFVRYIYPDESIKTQYYRRDEDTGFVYRIPFGEFHCARRRLTHELSMFSSTHPLILKEVHRKDQVHLTRLLIWLEYALLKRIGTREIPQPLIIIHRVFHEDK